MTDPNHRELIEPMTEAEILQWIDVCSYNPARAALRELLAARQEIERLTGERERDWAGFVKTRETYKTRAETAEALSRETQSRDEVVAAVAIIDEALRLFVQKRLALNGQYEAVDILREDGIYKIVIDDLLAMRQRYEKA